MQGQRRPAIGRPPKRRCLVLPGLLDRDETRLAIDASLFDLMIPSDRKTLHSDFRSVWIGKSHSSFRGDASLFDLMIPSDRKTL